ncbi:MAG: polyprenyl synthetase family protein [Chloroflexi bacterium]|nr:polyprenyl synthetase family protein [Chloroflexota bacterium]
MSTAQVLSLYQPIREDLLQVREDIRSASAVDFPELSEILGHVLNSTGKGTRPAITILASKFHPHDEQLPKFMASAVELLHIATLVHDDTVDKAAIRRGKATVSSLWGENAAVLVGDYLFAKSATCVCSTENVRVIRIFSETIMHLASGELKERFSAYDWTADRDQYWDRIRQKTASLFTTSAETGAILSGASETIIDAFHTYGHSLGMAFQIVDDILDFQGTESEVGKPVGNDLAQGVLTLPAILLQERYPNDNPIKALFQNPSDEGALKRAVEMIHNSSVIDDSYDVAQDFCSTARKALEGLPDNPYRRSLTELLSYILERKK